MADLCKYKDLMDNNTHPVAGKNGLLINISSVYLTVCLQFSFKYHFATCGFSNLLAVLKIVSIYFLQKNLGNNIYYYPFNFFL